MRKGNYDELVQELMAQHARKVELVVPSKSMSMTDGQLMISGVGEAPAMDAMLAEEGVGRQSTGRTLALTAMTACEGQIAEKLQIPQRYYDKMKTQAIDLLDTNVSHWFRENVGNYFVRAFAPVDGSGPGIARALLSDRFKVLDNLDVLTAAIQAIKQHPNGNEIQVEYCDITDTKMYVRFIAPAIELQAAELLKRYNVPGEGHNGKTGIMAGFVLQNSETGHSRFSISPRCHILACSNGLIFKDDQFARTHLGGKMEEGMIQWSEGTKEKNIALIISQVQDAVKTYLSPEYLGQKIAAMQEAGALKLQHPVAAVNNVCKAYSLRDSEKILNYFIEGADNTAFGVIQAVTYYAHKDADADMQYDLEVIGAELLGKMPMFDKK